MEDEPPSSSAPRTRALKRFGQNFLTDKRVVQRIIEAVQPGAHETIVEIGPGRGALTSALLPVTGALIAIEFDRELIPVLTQNFSNHQNLKLIEGDALEVDICSLIRPAKQTRVVANLPYNVSTAILQRMIDQRECITEMVLMLQREVVDRIMAVPGSAERGYFSVMVQAYCDVEKLFDVGPTSFRPAPKVWSSVVRLNVRRKIAVEVNDEQLLAQVVSAGFAQRRKTILNNLRNAAGSLQEKVKSNGGASIVLCRAEVDVQRRAETLTLAEWARITNALQ